MSEQNGKEGEDDEDENGQGEEAEREGRVWERTNQLTII